MSSKTPAMPEDLDHDGRWFSQHTRFLCQTREREPEVLLIGDSIIKYMQFSESYKRYLEPLHCINFGIYEDKTGNVLWRIENGELDGISPKVVIVHSGNHNVGESAEEIMLGIEAIIDLVRKKQPNAIVIVLGMLPCGRDPNPKRTKHEKINEMLSDKWIKDRVDKTVLLVPDWHQFIQADGTISHRDLHDYLHPTDQGYAKIIEMLLDELQICLPSSFLRPETIGIGASGESS